MRCNISDEYAASKKKDGKFRHEFSNMIFPIFLYLFFNEIGMNIDTYKERKNWVLKFEILEFC